MKPMFLTALICSLAIQDGFSQSSTTSLRELILARALYRCGDHNGLGKKTLGAYSNDFRGHYATHARAILGERK